jgi:hypothetical protein
VAKRRQRSGSSMPPSPRITWSRSVELAGAHAAKLAGTLATIKQRMYEPVLARLRDTEANRLFPAT